MPKTTHQLTKGKPCWVQHQENQWRANEYEKNRILSGKANGKVKLPARVGSLNRKIPLQRLHSLTTNGIWVGRVGKVEAKSYKNVLSSEYHPET